MIKCRGPEWSSKGKSSHLVLIAYDQKGWENLLLLTTRSNLEGFYCQPRIDYQMLREHSEGLFCHSACLGGHIARTIRAGQSPNLVAEMYKDIFGDRYSLEIQLNGQPEQEPYNDVLIKMSRDLKIPLIATVDSHYLNKSDSHTQDLVFCLGMDKQLNDPTRHRYPPEAHSVETPDEVCPRFINRYGEIGRQALARTIEISDNCNVNIEFETKNYKIPSFSIQEAADYADFVEWEKAFIKGVSKSGND